MADGDGAEDLSRCTARTTAPLIVRDSPEEPRVHFTCLDLWKCSLLFVSSVLRLNIFEYTADSHISQGSITDDQSSTRWSYNSIMVFNQAITRYGLNLIKLDPLPKFYRIK